MSAGREGRAPGKKNRGEQRAVPDMRLARAG
jgi:hypothetical protein